MSPILVYLSLLLSAKIRYQIPFPFQSDFVSMTHVRYQIANKRVVCNNSTTTVTTELRLLHLRYDTRVKHFLFWDTPQTPSEIKMSQKGIIFTIEPSSISWSSTMPNSKRLKGFLWLSCWHDSIEFTLSHCCQLELRWALLYLLFLELEVVARLMKRHEKWETERNVCKTAKKWIFRHQTYCGLTSFSKSGS